MKKTLPFLIILSVVIVVGWLVYSKGFSQRASTNTVNQQVINSVPSTNSGNQPGSFNAQKIVFAFFKEAKGSKITVTNADKQETFDLAKDVAVYSMENGQRKDLSIGSLSSGDYVELVFMTSDKESKLIEVRVRR